MKLSRCCVQLWKTCRKRVCNATHCASRHRLCAECRCDGEVQRTIRQQRHQRESARRITTRLQPTWYKSDDAFAARKAYPVPVTKQVLLCTGPALYPSAVHSIQELPRVSIEQAKWTKCPVLRRGGKREKERERPVRNWIYRCEIWFDSFSLKRDPESPRCAR